MKAYAQFATSSQFYLYGKKHFTATGYEKHAKSYAQPDIMKGAMDLSGRVGLITGGNSGVGKEVASFLASKGAKVFLLCRSRERAEAARDEIRASTGNADVHVLVGDVSLEADVRRCWAEFATMSESSTPRLDVLMCNAGALLNEKTLTSEGVETTFASHLLFGTYLLGCLALPSLEATAQSRIIVVSSGGMYNSAFPEWEVATSTSQDPGVKYDGQFAYVYAKRGQILLCEQWAKDHPKVKVVSCHPGWTETPAVNQAYGESKKHLEPMRTPWQGAEGIAWLCVVAAEKIESGAFYLDRLPQVKHLAGPFFTEGSHTKNSPEAVAAMMKNLDDWTSGRRPADLAERALAMEACVEAKQVKLEAMKRAIDLKSFMGKWYVHANIPTPFEKGAINCVEEYSLDEESQSRVCGGGEASQVVSINFTYCNEEMTKTSCIKQRAKVINDESTQWKLSPKVGIYLPLSIPYLIADCAEDYSSCIIGVPDRSYVWVMLREVKPDPSTLDALLGKVQALGYDITKINRVRQDWSQYDPSTSFVEETRED